MKKFFSLVWQDKITYWGFLASFLFMLVSFAVICIFYSKLPPFLPLYNKLPWGYARIGQKAEIFIYLSVGLLFFIANLIITSLVYKRIALLARFIAMTTLIAWFFILIFIIQIILLIK